MWSVHRGLVCLLYSQHVYLHTVVLIRIILTARELLWADTEPIRRSKGKRGYWHWCARSGMPLYIARANQPGEQYYEMELLESTQGYV